MKKLTFILSLIILLGIFFLDPVDYYDELKYRKILTGIIDDQGIMRAALDDEDLEILEVTHVSGNVFKFNTEDNSYLVSIEKEGSGHVFNFFEFNSLVSRSH